MNTTTTETTTAHTPAPWRYEPGTKTIRSVPANYWIATLDSWDGAVNNESNARLIAAAPELLAALEEIAAENMEFLSDRDELIRCAAIARAAIAKAEGTQP